MSQFVSKYILLYLKFCNLNFNLHQLLAPPNDLSISISTHHPSYAIHCNLYLQGKVWACLKCSFGGWGDAMLIEVKTKISLWSNLLELINLLQINLTSIHSILLLLAIMICFGFPIHGLLFSHIVVIIFLAFSSSVFPLPTFPSWNHLVPLLF